MDRNEQIKAERRRRDTSSLKGARRRLAVNERALDRENFVYRFANDDKNRIYDLTVNDDWEVVSDREGDINASDAIGAQASVRAGTDSEGKSMRTVLLRKPKAYHDADVAARLRQIDATEQSLKDVPKEAEKATTYMPDGGMKLDVET